MDKEYWINYYRKVGAPMYPTPFAEYIGKRLDTNKSILDIGCGNARDSIYFASMGLTVYAIDQAVDVVKENVKQHGEHITFIADDFINSSYLVGNQFDYLYSRFTMHAITKDEEFKLLKMAYRSLLQGGQMFIEARSVNDSLYGKGKRMHENAYFYNDHYRRFIDLDELTTRMEGIGFRIVEKVEGDNFAVYKDENPVVVRVVAEK